MKTDLMQLKEITDTRNAVLYNWLRWLVMLAAGLFAAMVGMMAGKTLTPAQWLAIKAALLLHAAGILSGSAALYGEVSVRRHQAQAAVSALADKIRGTHESEPHAATFSPLAKPYLWAEKACYTSLVSALLMWAVFVCLM